PCTIEPLDELRNRTPLRHLVDVRVGVLELAILARDGFRVFRPELRLIFEELLPPDRSWPAVHLVREEIEGLANVARPVGKLTVSPSGEAPVLEDVRPAESLEGRLAREPPDVHHARDDARGDGPADTVHAGEHFLPEAGSFYRLLKLALATAFF